MSTVPGQVRFGKKMGWMTCDPGEMHKIWHGVRKGRYHIWLGLEKRSRGRRWDALGTVQSAISVTLSSQQIAEYVRAQHFEQNTQIHCRTAVNTTSHATIRPELPVYGTPCSQSTTHPVSPHRYQGKTNSLLTTVLPAVSALTAPSSVPQVPSPYQKRHTIPADSPQPTSPPKA